jgi:hypothetical protein
MLSSNTLRGEPQGIPVPHCHGMTEHPDAAAERSRLLESSSLEHLNPLSSHILHGLAYTIGSALGSTPPSLEACLTAFVHPNKAGLTAGARAWTKHSHRSQGHSEREDSEDCDRKNATKASSGWWGTPSGPVAHINEKALLLFWKIINGASWRNLHWLPHRVLVYEARVPEGYGMRWSQDQSVGDDGTCEGRPWIFRGYIEPMMDNGHEVGWKH